MEMDMEEERNSSVKPMEAQKETVEKEVKLMKALGETTIMSKEISEMKVKEWFPDPRPHFFKIMYPGLWDKLLRIPPQFMKHLRGDFSQRAILKFSSGRFWSIQVRRAMGSIYLEGGWPQFLRDNSLGFCEFLTFRYEGNMCFSVKIFETSGCERINMPVAGIKKGFVAPEGKRKRGRPRKYPLGSLPKQSRKGDAGQHLPKLKPEKSEKEEKDILKKIKTKEIDLSVKGLDSTVKSSVDAKNFQRNITTGVNRPILKIDSHTRLCSLEKLSPVEEEEDMIRFQRIAESFNSEFPYFQSCLKRACVDKVFILNIPGSFSKLHLKNFKTKMFLQNLGGETWEVNCIPSGGKHYICGGWAAFVRGNNLKKGDICIFELLASNQMQVNIFPS